MGHGSNHDCTPTLGLVMNKEQADYLLPLLPGAEACSDGDSYYLSPGPTTTLRQIESMVTEASLDMDVDLFYKLSISFDMDGWFRID